MSDQDQTKQKLRDEIQNKVVNMITQGLKDGSISEDRARGIAAMILEKLPEDVTNEELIQILPHLDDEFIELTGVVLPIITEYDERIRKAVEEKALKLARARKFQEALGVIRKGLDYSRQIVRGDNDDTSVNPTDNSAQTITTDPSAQQGS
jgi:hypothetical protein